MKSTLYLDPNKYANNMEGRKLWHSIHLAYSVTSFDALPSPGVNPLEGSPKR